MVAVFKVLSTPTHSFLQSGTSNMIRFGKDRNVLSRMSKLLQSGHVDQVPIWYQVALRVPPNMHYPMMKPPKLASSTDRLNRVFDKEFMRVYKMDPNQCILPDRPAYDENSGDNCNYRAEFVDKWAKVMEGQPELSLSSSFDIVVEQMKDRLEESKARLVMLLRTQMDPENKYAGLGVKEIMRQKDLNRIDEIIIKRRKRLETMMGSETVSSDKDSARFSRSMSIVEAEILKRRTADNWTDTKV